MLNKVSHKLNKRKLEYLSNMKLGWTARNKGKHFKRIQGQKQNFVKQFSFN